MSRIFGERISGLTYRNRVGVYAVIFNAQKSEVLTVQTSRGHYFLPGGGLKENETKEECLKREMLEETGYELLIDSFIGNAMMFHQSLKGEPILGNGYFYLATLLNRVKEPIEEDHTLRWVNTKEMDQLLFHEHQIWAVKEGFKKWNEKEDE